MLLKVTVKKISESYLTLYSLYSKNFLALNFKSQLCEGHGPDWCKYSGEDTWWAEVS